MDNYFFVFKHFDGNSGMILINHSMINQSNRPWWPFCPKIEARTVCVTVLRLCLKIDTRPVCVTVLGSWRSWLCSVVE
jgi:hypothetical protein